VFRKKDCDLVFVNALDIVMSFIIVWSSLYNCYILIMIAETAVDEVQCYYYYCEFDDDDDDKCF